MIWDRREFISSTAFAGAALAVIPLAEGLDARADARQDTVKLEGRMTPYPATKYRPYVSKLAHSAQTTSWVQFDLGAATAVEGVRLYPNFNMEIRALGFPARMRIEGSNTPGFETVATLFDGSGADLPDPGDQIVFVATKAPQAASYRYVRLTASELRRLTARSMDFRLPRLRCSQAAGMWLKGAPQLRTRSWEIRRTWRN
jgi:hypothetical protein